MFGKPEYSTEIAVFIQQTKYFELSKEDGQKYIPTKASRSIRLHTQLNEPQTRREDTANLALSKRTLFPGSIHNKRFQRLSSVSNSKSRNDRGIDLFTGGMATAFHPQLCL